LEGYFFFIVSDGQLFRQYIFYDNDMSKYLPSFINAIFKPKVMGNWKGIVGTPFTPQEFDAYCHTIQWNAWRPSFIVLHNTYVPTLAQRPAGFTKQHILNLQTFFRDTQKWSAGPHLFIDDSKIWVFTPLNVSGVHSPSWNKQAIGIEMLGDYEKEDFLMGRGLEVRKNTIAAIATLSAVLGLDPATLKLHKEDPKTTHKTCPGKNVVKIDLIPEIIKLIGERHSGEHHPA
jgi:N-acetylmuramoyl-L-alanine amidase CwlA